MKKYILPLLVVFATSAYGQDAVGILRNTAVPVSETVFVSTNATTLITGETLHAKLHCLDWSSHTKSLISKIAYVELVGSDKKIIVRQKLMLEDGTAGVDIFIPTTLQSGNYKLIAYTKWMLGTSLKNFFETDIAVINPYVVSNFVQSSADKTVNPSATTPDAFIKTDKKTYHTREDIALRITAPIGNYSVSVRKTDGIFQKSPLRPKEFFQSLSAKPSTRMNNVVASLPELRGELLTGKIVSKTTSAVKDKSIALTIKGQSFSFKMVKTDAAGSFSFLLDDSATNPEVVVQLVDDNRADYTISLDEPTDADLSDLQFSSTLPFTASDKEAILQRSIANQIQNAYYTAKKDSVKVAAKTPPFFNSVGKDYVLDDYTRFPTIRETITEVVREMGYSKSKKGFTVFVRNYYTETAIYGPPLVLLDGFPIQDMNTLFDYPASNIQKISVINSPYIYGPKTFSGVLSFVTKSNDFEPATYRSFIKKTAILRPAPAKIYFSPDYSGEKQNNRIPDYRHQLFWAPDWKSTSNDTPLHFFTSDVTGNFEITVEGFTQNGEPLFLRDFIHVE